MVLGAAPSSPAPVATLPEAVASMERLDAQFPARDGVRHFNALYLEVTREVEGRLRAGGAGFEHPRFLEHLAIVFSNAYFQAVADFAGPAAERGSRAWAPLFVARFDRRVAPIQFALAGMNAHINFDLPVAVRETCLALGLAPRDDTPQHGDYVRLNAILADVQQRVKPWLAPGLLGVIDRAFGRLDDIVASFSVARARDAAWIHSQTLWSIRDDERLTAAYERTLSHTVGFAGRGLVGPSLLGLARWAGGATWLPRPVRRLLGAPPRDLSAR